MKQKYKVVSTVVRLNRTTYIPLGVLVTGCLSLFHLGLTSMSSSSLSEECEEA